MPRRSTIRQRLEALVEEHEPLIRDAFLSAIDDIKSRAELGRIIERLERGDIEGALSAVHLDPAAFRPVERAITATFEAGGTGGVSSLPKLRDPDGSSAIIRFDARNLRAETWLRDNSTDLVTRIVEDQRTAIRAALNQGMIAGKNPRSTALDIVGRIDRATGRRQGGIIGLTEAQTRYVANARQELLDGTEDSLRAYLARNRRDKRFDRAVLQAIKDGKPLPSELVDRMTQRYSDSLLQLRGEMLARTESMHAIHAGQNEAYQQAIDRGSLRAEAVTRIWRVGPATPNARDGHQAMSGQRVGMGEAFVTPSGNRMLYPCDTSLGAPASEIVGCRCRVDFEIDRLSGVL